MNSNCHQAPLKVVSGDEGTSYWICTECKQPADPHTPEPVDTSVSNLVADARVEYELALKRDLPIPEAEAHHDYMLEKWITTLIAQKQAEAVEAFANRLIEQAEELNNGELDDAHWQGLAVPLSVIQAEKENTDASSK